MDGCRFAEGRKKNRVVVVVMDARYGFSFTLSLSLCDTERSEMGAPA